MKGSVEMEAYAEGAIPAAGLFFDGGARLQLLAKP
jgi:hypothetical protein